MSDSALPRILGIGIAPRDLTVRLPHWPGPDEKLPAEDFSESGGGPVPNALLVLAGWGFPTAFAGVVGDDPGGRLVREELALAGVDVTGLRTRPANSTPTSVVLVHGADRAILEWGQTGVDLTPAEIEGIPDLGRTALFLADGRLPRAQVEVARRVRAAGGLVLLDAGRSRPGIEALLPFADVAVFGRAFPPSAPGAPSAPEAFAAWLSDRLAPSGLRIGGVTLGPDGCVLHVPGTGTIRIPACPVAVVDSTGAGDAWHGAFAAALLDGEPVPSAARFAGAAAALACRSPTGRGGLPPRETVRRFAEGKA